MCRVWDPGWVPRSDFGPAWQGSSARLSPSHHPPPPMGSQSLALVGSRLCQHKEFWCLLRDANTGAFRLERHRGLEPAGKCCCVPHSCGLQPHVFSLGTVQPGKEQALAMVMPCELLAHSGWAGPALCFDHPLALRVLFRTGGCWGVPCIPTGGCCSLDHPC